MRVQPVTLAAALAACASAGPASGPVALVEAEGRAVVSDDDAAGAKARARTAAELLAVSTLVDLHLSRRLRAEARGELERTVLSRPRDFVESLEILDEGTTGPVARVLVRAGVRLVELGRALAGVAPAAPADPLRVGVWTQESAEGVEELEPDGAARLLSSVVERAGCQLASAETDARADAALARRRLEAGDAAGLAELGRRTGADVVVLGDVRAAASGRRAGSFRYEAAVSLRAYEAATGRLLLELAHSAQAAGSERGASARESIRKAVSESGDRLAAGIALAWARRLRLELRARGLVRLSDLGRLERSLEEGGVVSFALRSFVPNLAVLEAWTEAEAAAVASALGRGGWKAGVPEARVVEVEAPGGRPPPGPEGSP